MSEIPPPTIPPATPPPPGGGSYTPPPPPPPGGGYTGGPSAGGGDRTIWLVLSYLGILSLIPFFGKKDDPEVRWHAKNGVALFGAEVVVWVVLFIVGIVLRNSCSSAILIPINCVVWIGFLVISIICIVKAVGGQRYRIPIITDYAEKL